MTPNTSHRLHVEITASSGIANFADAWGRHPSICSAERKNSSLVAMSAVR
jgi:hypothetical protein